MGLKGTCVCPGTVEGTLRFYLSGQSAKAGDIIIFKEWLTQDVLQAKEATGFISTKGGITCHASIIAREINVPSLISVNISSLQEGQKVRLDATRGVVELL